MKPKLNKEQCRIRRRWIWRWFWRGFCFIKQDPREAIQAADEMMEHWIPEECPNCGAQGTVTGKLFRSCLMVEGEEIDCMVPKCFCSGCGGVYMTTKQADKGVQIATQIWESQRDRENQKK